MDDVKGFFSSKTIWGGIIAVGAGVAGLLGYALSADDQAAISQHIDSVIAAVGGLLAIYGRIKAAKAIG